MQPPVLENMANFYHWLNQINCYFRCDDKYSIHQHMAHLMELEDIFIEWEKIPNRREKLNQTEKYKQKLYDYIQNIINSGEYEYGTELKTIKESSDIQRDKEVSIDQKERD